MTWRKSYMRPWQGGAKWTWKGGAKLRVGGPSLAEGSFEQSPPAVGKQVEKRGEDDLIGNCPRCGGPVYLGKSHKCP